MVAQTLLVAILDRLIPRFQIPFFLTLCVPDLKCGLCQNVIVTGLRRTNYCISTDLLKLIPDHHKCKVNKISFSWQEKIALACGSLLLVIICP